MQKKRQIYVINSSTKINTKNPKRNDHVQCWTDDSCYILCARNGRKYIVAGCGNVADYTPYVVDNTVVLADDGNRTFRGAGRYDVLAHSDTVEGIKNFPAGSYSLLAMK